MARRCIQAEAAGVHCVGVWGKQGKALRAAPVAGMYGRGMIRHYGVHDVLESQMTAMTPDFNAAKAGYSPNNLDACVYCGLYFFDELVPELAETPAGEYRPPQHRRPDYRLPGMEG
jgi:phage terminase large subunit-like protein